MTAPTIDLRDHTAAFDAAARRLLFRSEPEPIPLTRAADIGAILRDLRHKAGLSQRALARGAHITKSGLAAREQRSSMSAGALVEHAHALGYAVVLVPAPRTAYRRAVKAGALTPDRRTA